MTQAPDRAIANVWLATLQDLSNQASDGKNDREYALALAEMLQRQLRRNNWSIPCTSGLENLARVIIRVIETPEQTQSDREYIFEKLEVGHGNIALHCRSLAKEPA